MLLDKHNFLWTVPTKFILSNRNKAISWVTEFFQSCPKIVRGEAPTFSLFTVQSALESLKNNKYGVPQYYFYKDGFSTITALAVIACEENGYFDLCPHFTVKDESYSVAFAHLFLSRV